MKQMTLKVEDKEYIIKRVTAKQKYEIIQAGKDKGTYESNVLAVEYSLVSPQLSRKEIEEMDSAHFDYLNVKIAELNDVAPFLELPSPNTSQVTARQP